MRSVILCDGGRPSSVLGFGCASMMGRVSRKGSLAAINAAYDAGITFYDTARSYGYGEAEGLLGEFLRGRRDSVVLSTKFGILPAPASALKRVLKPIARTALKALPSARKAVQSTLASQFSAGHFSVAAMRSSVETSLRNLQTGYVDLLFLHLPPVSVLQQEDLLAALEQLSVEGKVLRSGIACETPQAIAALAADHPTLRTVQAPCDLFDLTLTNDAATYNPGTLTIANHPFGGPLGVAESKALIATLARDSTVPAALQEKLRPADDATLADLVLNLITVDTNVKAVIPSMLDLKHLRTNIDAMEHSRFTVGELRTLRHKLAFA